MTIKYKNSIMLTEKYFCILKFLCVVHIAIIPLSTLDYTNITINFTTY